jgi:transposase
MAGLDLGLKTWGVLRIWEPDPKGQDPRGREVARYFLDQKQLEGARHPRPGHPRGWRHGKPGRAGLQHNWKRHLTRLREEAAARQGAMQRCYDAVRARGQDPRRTMRYFKLRRRWQEAWAKVRHLHEEVARQLATRVIAACQRHNVTYLRVEDLSWSRHGARAQKGYYLGTWQTHWFFSQIQDLLFGLGQRHGVVVERVKAAYTSTRCSAAGCRYLPPTKAARQRARQGKTFRCPKCGLQLDADLNAARNIVDAPRAPVQFHSPCATGAGGQVPVSPT